MLCKKGALLKTYSEKFYNGSVWKNVSDGDYLSIKMAVTRKDPIYLKWTPSQIYSELENKLHHIKLLGKL